jgi:tetratricopeptide (TPR) repeat protein
MQSVRSSVRLAVLVLITACAGQEGQPDADVVMGIPMTTSSEEARDRFLQGQHAMDMVRFFEAQEHFEWAVESDPDFALGYWNLANTATSTDQFMANLRLAQEKAPGASEAEQLLIEITSKGLDNDAQGQLQSAQRLVEVVPESPRAWLTLAGIQTGLNDNTAARASMMTATELAPNFAPAYMQLGNSFLFNDPVDLAKVEEYMSKVVELEPNEANSHDLMGDAYRALNQLEQARASYTRAAELDPGNASPLQQRGHVNSFLGNYDEARADYDSSIAMGVGNQKAAFAVYRAFVGVHEGNPQAAIDELIGLADAIGTMDLPGPTGQTIFALTSAAQIALHHNMLDAAESALERRKPLLMEQAERVGTEAFSRGQQANIAYWDGVLAARRGDYAAATEKASEFMSLLETDANPRRNEAAHDLLGMVSLLQGDYTAAVEHYRQANPANIYTKYHLALALEGAGSEAEARQIFQDLTSYNFNSVGYALIRKDAIEKAS